MFFELPEQRYLVELDGEVGCLIREPRSAGARYISTSIRTPSSSLALVLTSTKMRSMRFYDFIQCADFPDNDFSRQ
jgi:hypothetical protein